MTFPNPAYSRLYYCWSAVVARARTYCLLYAAAVCVPKGATPHSNNSLCAYQCFRSSGLFGDSTTWAPPPVHLSLLLVLAFLQAPLRSCRSWSRARTLSSRLLREEKCVVILRDDSPRQPQGASQEVPPPQVNPQLLPRLHYRRLAGRGAEEIRTQQRSLPLADTFRRQSSSDWRRAP